MSTRGSSSSAPRPATGRSDAASGTADVVGDPRAAVVDLELTTVVDGTLVKVMAWYDNEWGFTHQMIRQTRNILGTGAGRAS